MFRFHLVCGSNIKLSPDLRSAERTSPKTDFNNAIVFTDRTLETNVIFQLQIQKKISVWNGGLEIGVTTLNPNSFSAENTSNNSEASPAPLLPQIATELKNGTWLMSSHMILENGEILLENYGYDLEKLNEGDTVGLMRTSQGSLIYFVNGTPQGIAVQYIPNDVFCIVSLYGKCSQVEIVDVQVADQCTNTVELSSSSTSDIFTAAEAAAAADENESVVASLSQSLYADSSPHTDNNISEHDKLRFHEKCGPLVKLTNHNRAAERIRPMEEFNNAVVLTHRFLKMNELFQVRLDLIIAKWSGSLEFGLTGHKPETFDLPATLTVVKNTVIMSGNGVLHNGRATSAPYSHFNLDQLQEGDRIGVMMKANGEVHYFVNGSDQGVATTGLSPPVWGCINLYGMAAKVTIVDRNEHEEHNLRLSVRGHDFLSTSGIEASDSLIFHPNCGFHAAVISGGRTAHRPNARDDFNHGVVLTNRTLKSNELFTVVLNKLVKKWAGSIEIGVTTHAPGQLEYPCTMTNVRTGTWILTGNGIMHNGVSIIDDYGQSLDKLKVGDTVGVMRKSNGNLHFFVNGEDQGCAATNVPPAVYGVIDLYGQAAEATIVSNGMDNSNLYLEVYPPDNSFTSINTDAELSLESAKKSNSSEDLRFHAICGKNARVSNNGMTVSRPNALGEFNAAIAMSSRELRDNELFEVIIQRMIDRWSGNLEIGVTTIPPHELDFPNTMTDVDHDVWILSGSNIMIGGSTVTQRYNCNLDSLTVGSRAGIMRKSDNTLHFYVNGQDKGVAATDIPKSVWAVFDLYGQCQQISIVKPDVSMLSSQIAESAHFALTNELGHRFSNCCGKNIVLKSNNLEAARIRHYTNALVFSSLPVEIDEVFEVRISEINQRWAGCLVFGITTLCLCDDSPASSIPYSISSICSDTWFVAGSQVRKNNVVIRDNYCSNLHRLCIGDRVGLRISGEKCLHFYINGEDMGIAVYHLPNVPMYAVFDIFGKSEAIVICSTAKNFISPTSELHFVDNEDVEDQVSPEASPVCISVPVPPVRRDSVSTLFSFHPKYCGTNIELSDDCTRATRKSSYNEGIVLTNEILKEEQIFQVRISQLNPSWTSSIRIGVIESSLEYLKIPWNALLFKPRCCIISEDSVYQNGYNVKTCFGPNLDTLQEADLVGIYIDTNCSMHLVVNGYDHGVAANNVGTSCRAVVDLYGKCEQISIVTGDTVITDVSSLKCFVNGERSTEEITLPHCEYMDACTSFKDTLCLPEPYFPEVESAICFCRNCTKARGEELIVQHGDPPSKYCQPVGWVRFPININFDYTTENESSMMTSSSSSLNNMLSTWHVAYHGLRISHVREVLDVGQLFACDEYGNAMDDPDKDVLLFSPIPDYAGLSDFSPSHPYTEFSTKKKWHARVAYQILAKPGSYKMGPVSISNFVLEQENQYPEGEDIDLQTIEWSTKEERSTHVTALLVRLEEVLD